MNEKLAALAERKQKLLYQATLQRAAIGQCMDSLRRPIAIADRGMEVVRYFKRYPVFMTGVSAITGILISKLHLARFTALMHTSWSVFQLVRHMRESVHKDVS